MVITKTTNALFLIFREKQFPKNFPT